MTELTYEAAYICHHMLLTAVLFIVSLYTSLTQATVPYITDTFSFPMALCQAAFKGDCESSDEIH